MAGLTRYDLEVIQNEGKDTRQEIKRTNERLRETNDLLMNIIKELAKLNVK